MASRLPNQPEQQQIASLIAELAARLEAIPEKSLEALHPELERLASYVKESRSADEESRKEVVGILESINDGFFAFDRSWNYTYINHQAAEPLGKTPEEMIGKNLWETFPKLRGTVAEKHYRMAMEEGIQSQYRVRGIYSQRWYDIRVYPSKKGISVISIDRTEQIEAEQALRKSEERFRIALSNSPVAVFSTDQELRYTWFYNPQMGFMQAQLLGKRDDEILPAENVKELMEIKRRALETRQAVQAEIKFHVFTGERIMIASAEPYLDPYGEIEGVIGALFDITEQRRLEAENIEHITQAEVQRRLLEYREKERQEIARDLHDGPVQDLSGLIFNIQFTKEAVADNGLLVELEAINRGLKSVVHDLRGMINELRPPSLIRFGLSRAAQMYLEDFQERHPGIEMDIRLIDDQNMLSEQIRLTLFRIFQEALNNAAKHADASRLSVTFRCQPDHALLEIRDNGKGFTLSNQLVDYTVKGHFGLVGMKERAEAVGGTLQVLSKQGEGTIIRVSVPLQKK